MNLSRELLQNSSLLTKLSDVMTTKVIKWLQSEAKKDPAKYTKFFQDFGPFLKEGVCVAEPKHQVRSFLDGVSRGCLIHGLTNSLKTSHVMLCYAM